VSSHLGKGEGSPFICAELKKGDAGDGVDLGEMHVQGATGETTAVHLGRRDVIIPGEGRGVKMGKFVHPFRDFAEGVFKKTGGTPRNAPRSVRRPAELVRVSRVAFGLVESQPMISKNHPSAIMEPMYILTGEGWRRTQDRGGVWKLL